MKNDPQNRKSGLLRALVAKVIPARRGKTYRKIQAKRDHAQKVADGISMFSAPSPTKRYSCGATHSHKPSRYKNKAHRRVQRRLDQLEKRSGGSINSVAFKIDDAMRKAKPGRRTKGDKSRAKKWR